uniref:Uncharacterized protein n=2 Tax=Timema TaxID=61471 RepID=A0A7R9K5F4_TIMGE|nr:unnamed protein product [Timema genevievae]
MANGSESGKMEFINVERLTTELSDGVFGKNDTATGVDLNKTKVLFENSLLAGGDGLATPKPNVSTDFILNESAISPDASNGAKRKRDESPEHYSLVMDEDVEEAWERETQQDSTELHAEVNLSTLKKGMQKERERNTNQSEPKKHNSPCQRNYCNPHNSQTSATSKTRDTSHFCQRDRPKKNQHQAKSKRNKKQRQNTKHPRQQT